MSVTCFQGISSKYRVEGSNLRMGENSSPKMLFLEENEADGRDCRNPKGSQSDNMHDNIWSFSLIRSRAPGDLWPRQREGIINQALEWATECRFSTIFPWWWRRPWLWGSSCQRVRSDGQFSVVILVIIMHMDQRTWWRSISGREREREIFGKGHLENHSCMVCWLLGSRLSSHKWTSIHWEVA